MPLQPRIWVLLLAKPKCVWKSGQPVLNSTEISIQKRNGISKCPCHGMLCSLAQHKPSPSHASHVGSKLRQVTCATRMVGRSLLRALTKFSVTVATSSHRIIRGLISPDWPRFSEEPGFVMSDAPQHQFGAHREHCPAHQWLEQLDECGIDPLNLALQVFKPWEAVSHSAHSSQRERSRRIGKGKKGGKQEGKQQHPPWAGPGTGKGRNW